MFRIRKPSVQRASVGKQEKADVPDIKPEPRAVVGEVSEVPHPFLSDNTTTSNPSGFPNDVKQAKASRPNLPPLPLSEVCDQQMRENHSEADVKTWQTKTQYKPWHANDDDGEDLTREVRKDRKVSPQHDPLLAQMFAMFPEESAAK